MASIISCSEISFISPSTITIESLVPPTIISKSAFAAFSMLGFTESCPSILTTLTSDIGPLKGMSEIAMAADAAKPAKVSGITSLS